LIEQKYKISETDFEKMDRNERNFILEKMCDQSVVVFSSGADGKQADGMPVLNILLNDLKTILQ
tara:strand:+ start:565 stop:756 length:192 start_codon:yes stop_codon:yes gene_type:complete